MTTNLPAYLQNLRRVSDKIPVSSLQPPRLSIYGNGFTLIDGAGSELKVGAMDPKVGLCFDVHIFDANEHTAKRYRPEGEAFQEDNPTPPTCWSDDGVKPSTEVQQKQSDTCLGCKWNERGSAISKVSGKATKACQDIQKIAFMVAGMDTVFQMVVTPGSLGTFRNYNKMLKDQNYDIAYVITRIFFVGQGKLDFQAVKLIDEGQAIQAKKVLDGGGSDFAVSRSDKPKEIAPPTPTAQIGYPPSPERDRQDVIVAKMLQNGTQTPYVDKANAEKRGRGRPPKARENETVVGPGPIPPATPWPGVAQEFPQGEPASPFIAAPPAATSSPPQTAVLSVIQASPSFGVEPHPLPPTQEIEDAIARAFELPV